MTGVGSASKAHKQECRSQLKPSLRHKEMSVVAEGGEGVGAHGAARGDVAGGERDG